MTDKDEFVKKFTTGAITYFSHGEYFDGDTPPDTPLTTILGLSGEDLKPFTVQALQFFEDHESVKELKQGFQAYLQFQDILGVALHNNSPMENRHYCYYESLVYLRESVVSWLDKNVLAALTLLRPFLELSVMHLYWYLRCEQTGYEPFYKWLQNEKGKPPFKNQLEYVFSNILSQKIVRPERIKRIREVLEKVYGGSSTYNHTPKVDESIVGINRGTGNISLESFFFYIASVNIVLRQVVYLYVLVYPLCLFPVDRYRRWAFGGPLGVFFDENNGAVLTAYLGKENVEKLRDEIKKSPTVTSTLEWFEGHPELTDTEIENEWNNLQKSEKQQLELPDLRQRIAYHKARMRAIGWAMNYVHVPFDADSIPDEAVERISDMLKKW